MRSVTLYFHIRKSKRFYIFNIRIYLKSRKRIRGQLINISEGLNMIVINMHIAKHMHKLSSLQSRNLSHKASQQRITSNVERNTKTHITTALVHQAIQSVVACDLELAQKMAWGQGHFTQLAWVPGRHYQSTAVWVAFQLLQDPFQLIYSFSLIILIKGSIRSIPMSPLESVYRSQISSFPINPNTFQILFRAIPIPNMNIFFLQLFGISGSLDKPQQFLDNTSPKYFFMRKKRKSLTKIIFHHSTKMRFCTCACPILFGIAGLDDGFNGFEILVLFVLGLGKEIFRKER